MATQDTFTARKLLNKSFRMVGITEPGETIEGDQAIEALQLLNEILSSDSATVPYFSNISFTLKAGKSTYTLGRTPEADVNTRKLISLNYAQYKIDTTFYKITALNFSKYYGNYRIGTTGQPYFVLLQNNTYVSTLTFYPAPDKDYDIILNAKQLYDDLEMDDRLDEIPSTLYMFLRYALARELVEIYHGITWTPKQEETYQKLLSQALATSDKNYMVDSDSIGINPYSVQAVLNGYGL